MATLGAVQRRIGVGGTGGDHGSFEKSQSRGARVLRRRGRDERVEERPTSLSGRSTPSERISPLKKEFSILF